MTDRHIWESIDTAPKDGTLMFLDYGDGVLYIGQWRDGGWVAVAYVMPETGGGDVLVPGVDIDSRVPLRWTCFPLPPLPYREEDEAA